jgi:hypothetical protein
MSDVTYKVGDMFKVKKPYHSDGERYVIYSTGNNFVGLMRTDHRSYSFGRPGTPTTWRAQRVMDETNITQDELESIVGKYLQRLVRLGE